MCAEKQPAGASLMLDVEPNDVAPGSLVALTVHGIPDGHNALFSMTADFGPIDAEVRAYGLTLGRADGDLGASPGPRERGVPIPLGALDGRQRWYVRVPADAPEGDHVVCIKGHLERERSYEQRETTLGAAVHVRAD